MKLLPTLDALHGEAVGGRAWNARAYRRLFGWEVEQHAERVVLRLGHGMAALIMPVPIAKNVVTRLRPLDAHGPVFAVDGDRPHWVFLADADGHVTAPAELPEGVEVIDCGRRIPVPAADTPFAGLRWIVPPDPLRRWLPTVSALRLAIRPAPSMPVTVR